MMRRFPFRITELMREYSSSSNNSRDIQQYLNLSKSLYKIGVLRFAADKTSTNVYKHFAEANQMTEDSKSPGIREFLTMSQMIVEFGLPELADQMSGSVYMHAGVEEDKCSQCLRLADSEIPNFCINDLKLSLETMYWWPSEVNSSLATRELIGSLDSTCIDRLHSLHFSLVDQLRITHLWQSLIFQPRVEYPARVLQTVSEYVMQSNIPVMVSYLFLLSTLENNQIEDILGKSPDNFSSKIGEVILPSIPFLTESELVAAYMGLSRMGESAERAELKGYLEAKFGLRL